MSRLNFRQAPRRVRKAQLDNVALVPANLLPFKKEYQAIANGLPAGGMLIILPKADSPQRRALESVAADLKTKGQAVMVRRAKL